MNLRYYTCDVFSANRFGGNQLAVVLGAEQIPDDLLQPIAREFNFSETSFIYPPQQPHASQRVRIFTPHEELPFAGHPTIGTAVTLAAIGALPDAADGISIVLEEGVGDIPVTIQRDSRGIFYAEFTTAKLPEIRSDVPDVSSLAEILSLSPTDIHTEQFPVRAVSCGVPFLFVPVKDRKALRSISIDLGRMRDVLHDAWAKDIFVYTTEAEAEDSHFRARMFAPLLGIPEDPATGSACAAFAGYLADHKEYCQGSLRWKIEQGYEMGRPSIIIASAERHKGATTAIHVGGNAVMMSEGVLEI